MRKILLIEDEMRLHGMFESLFSAEGFRLISAYDGQSGLKLAEEIGPDMILLDLILPIKDGFETLRELKNNPRLAKIPVIVLTNLEGKQDMEKVFSMGARAYIVKANSSLREILEKVKKTLNKHES